MRAATLAVLASFLLTTDASAELVLTLRRDAGRLEFAGSVTNSGPAAVSSPLLRFDVTPALRMSVTMAPAWTCTPPSPETVVCGGTVLQPGETIGFTLFANSFGSTPGNYRITVEAMPDGNRIDLTHTIPHVFSAHTGAQLHDAIAQANANCQDDVPCSIVVNIPTEAGVLHLPVTQPLPVVTACRFSILAPRRPPDLSDLKHTFSGAGLTTAAPALELRPSCDGAEISIDGFHLSGFRGDAIAITGTARGTFDINRTGLFTGGRGVSIDNPNADVTITDTTIATGRSGVTAWAAKSTTIASSEIGPTRASGVFIGPNGGSVTLRDSLVRDNDHFGIALTPGNATLALENTRVDNNTALDIDWGLDGPGSLANVPPTPRVTSVTYDAASNVTTVVVDARGAGSGTIEVWSSDSVTIFGTAHLEQFHGRAAVGDSVRIEVPGDLGARFVGAIRVENGRVSEPSFAVRRL